MKKLHERVEQYLAIRRSLGFKLEVRGLAFSGQGFDLSFTLRVVNSQTRREPHGEVGNQLPSADVYDYTRIRCIR